MMTEQEKELLRTYKEKVEIQDKIINRQKELIDKLEQLKELQEEEGMRIAYQKGYQQALEDIREEHWKIYKEKANEK
jgi:hypothetical protein